MNERLRTKVEIIDPCGEDGYLVRPKEIHINGQAVLVEAGTLDIEYSDDEVVRVHLTILPDSVTFRRGPKKDTGRSTGPHQHFNTLRDMRMIATVVQDAKAGKSVVICGTQISTRNAFEVVLELLDGYVAKAYRANGNERITTTTEGCVRVVNSPDRLRGMKADTVWLVDEPKTEDQQTDWKASIHPVVSQSQTRTIIYPTD